MSFKSSLKTVAFLAMSVKSAQAGQTQEIKKPSDEDLKKLLTPTQYKVTQKEDTEAPFQNEYWDNKQEGIYVDVVSGEPLFSSQDKFDSGTGWPSFTRPLVSNNIIEKADRKLGYERIEVKSKKWQAHLGHVFNDGPAPTGLRYCINSAALKFIPKEKLKEDGYEEFGKIFDSKNMTEASRKQKTAKAKGQ